MGGILRRVKRAEAKKRESKAAGEEKKGQKYIQGDVKESVLKEEWRKKKLINAAFLHQLRTHKAGQQTLMYGWSLNK